MTKVRKKLNLLVISIKLCYNTDNLKETKWPYPSPLFNIGGNMLENKVRKLIEEPINKMGITIDSITYLKEGNNYFLRIIIDRDKPIDIDTVVEVTRIVNPILDENDITEDSYILDISSKEKGV